MKAHVWDHETSFPFPPAASRRSRGKRKTIAQILRDAYRKHSRDPHTRRAVKRWLR